MLRSVQDPGEIGLPAAIIDILQVGPGDWVRSASDPEHKLALTIRVETDFTRMDGFLDICKLERLVRRDATEDEVGMVDEECGDHGVAEHDKEEQGAEEDVDSKQV